MKEALKPWDELTKDEKLYWSKLWLRVRCDGGKTIDQHAREMRARAAHRLPR